MGGRFAPLGVRPFGRLLASYTVNDLGDSVGLVALALLVYDRTQAVAPTAGFFVIAKFLPALVAPALTARLDQLPLRAVLPILYLAEALAFGGLALLAHSRFVLAPVLTLGFLDGCIAITARGLTRGAVAAVLQPKDLLRQGNALMNVGFAISSVGGAALGGLLISWFGLSTALLADAGSFLVIALLLLSTAHLPRPELARERFRERFVDGLRYARSSPPIRLLLAGETLALICFTLIVPIEVIYAKESLGTTSAGFGILLASWGAGIVLGSLVYLSVRTRAAWTLIVASTAAIGCGYLGMAVAGSLAVACAASVIGGTGNGIQWISVVTALQEATPTTYQARVTGFLESLGAAMPGVGYLLGGVIVAVSSPRTAYAAAGIAIMCLVAGALAVRGRAERRPPLPAFQTDPQTDPGG